jgi:hypothetical protein
MVEEGWRWWFRHLAATSPAGTAARQRMSRAWSRSSPTPPPRKPALDALKKRATTPDDLAEVLVALRPIARGNPGEIELIEAALATPNAPALQQAAVAVAGAAAQRNPDAYRDTLVRSLTAADPELRRIAFAAVRQLGNTRAQPLYAAALAKDPDAAIRRELLVEVAGDEPDSAPPTADAAIPVLADADASATLRDRAKAQMRRAFLTDAVAASIAAARLVGDENAPTDSRVFAIRTIRGRRHRSRRRAIAGRSGAPRLQDRAVRRRPAAVRRVAVGGRHHRISGERRPRRRWR